MADKTHPFGLTLEYDIDNAGDDYVAVGDIIAVTPPSISFGSAETTVLDSANAFKEYIASWGDGGDISFTIRFAKAQLAALYALVRVTYYWKIKFPLVGSESTESEWLAQGFITAIDTSEGSAESDDVFDVDVTIKVTGKPTFTAGS